MMQAQTDRLTVQLQALLLLSPFFLGLCRPWGAAAASLYLTAVLLGRAAYGRLRLSRSPCLLAMAAAELFLLLGAVWGIDRGMAPVGAAQFLPLPLYVLALEQVEAGERLRLLRPLPCAGAVMVLFSLLLSAAPALRPYFIINGRLGGFFQYPNTFAVWLLAGTGVLLLRVGEAEPDAGKPAGKSGRAIVRRDTGGRAATLCILIAGIGLSGSRAVWILLLALLVIHATREKARGGRIVILAVTALLLAVAAIWLLLTGRASLATFLGRLLYAQDALPVILRHPLGLGYLGYSWLQGSFQSGVYTVTHVHNELLQLSLDTGWVPTGLLLWALWRSFAGQPGTKGRKPLLLLLCCHCLLDFDTQFVAFAFVLLTLLDTEPAAGKDLKRSRPAFLAGTAAALFSLWIGVASAALALGSPAAALRIDPFYTTALVQEMMHAEGEEKEALADRVLALNKSAAAAHEARATAALADRRMDTALEEMRETVRLSRYSQDVWLEYLTVLQRAWEQAERQGERETARAVLEEMAGVPAEMREILEQTSALGRSIPDQPHLQFPEEIRSWLAKRGFNSY